MQWNAVRCEYRLDESDRTAIHEAAHATINLIFLADPGTVEVGYSGRHGECRELRKADLRIDDSPRPAAIHRACASLAGYCGEEIGLGKARVEGCTYDFQTLDLAMKHAREAGLPLDRKGLEEVVRFLLTKYWPSVVLAAAGLHPGRTVPGEKLAREMFRRDDSGGLAMLAAEPVMGPHWEAAWKGVKMAAGRDYARQYMNQRH